MVGRCVSFSAEILGLERIPRFEAEVKRDCIKSPEAPEAGSRRQSYRGSCSLLVSGEPEVVKSVAQQESLEVQDVLRPLGRPEHAGVIEPLADHDFASCLHDAGADEEAL